MVSTGKPLNANLMSNVYKMVFPHTANCTVSISRQQTTKGVRIFLNFYWLVRKPISNLANEIFPNPLHKRRNKKKNI